MHCKSFTKTIHKLPSAQSLQNVVRGFETKWGMIQCAGSVDGYHIPILPPVLNHTGYYNGKGWYSIVLQAVVDHKYSEISMLAGLEASMMQGFLLFNSI